jgi:hypothetical protein
MVGISTKWRLKVVSLMLCFAWAALITLGLWLAWIVVRYLLPWLAMVGIVGAVIYCGVSWHQAHIREVSAAVCGKACRETGSLVPKLEPPPRRRGHATAPAASVTYCGAHPDADICEDRD